MGLWSNSIDPFATILVKTLAIRGTAEETMVERRNLFKGSNDKVPKLLEESGMRHFIAVSIVILKH